jgi:hypothetical protein
LHLDRVKEERNTNKPSRKRLRKKKKKKEIETFKEKIKKETFICSLKRKK